jgi:hypothetical protein
MPQNSPSHQTYTGDVPYESPVLRPPSPTGSIDTEYGQDETEEADRLLNDREFEAKIMETLKIDRLSETEKQNNDGPILYTFKHRNEDIQPGSHAERSTHQLPVTTI